MFDVYVWFNEKVGGVKYLFFVRADYYYFSIESYQCWCCVRWVDCYVLIGIKDVMFLVHCCWCVGVVDVVICSVVVLVIVVVLVLCILFNVVVNCFLIFDLWRGGKFSSLGE